MKSLLTQTYSHFFRNRKKSKFFVWLIRVSSITFLSIEQSNFNLLKEKKKKISYITDSFSQK